MALDLTLLNQRIQSQLSDLVHHQLAHDQSASIALASLQQHAGNPEALMARLECAAKLSVAVGLNFICASPTEKAIGT